MSKLSYFPGLNTIRLYAAICVLIGHIPDLVPGYSFSSRLPFGLSFLVLSGQQSVSLFFVLSGFLITYILLREQHETGTIAVKRFYIRRALRIQPLYILIVVLALTIAILPKPDLIGLIGLTLLSPHVINVLGGVPGAASHLWSIGVEEWFYFSLPPLMKRINVPLLAAVIIIIRFAIGLLIPDVMILLSIVSDFTHLILNLKFESMAVGMLGAWMVFHQHWTLRWVYKLELPTLLLMVVLILIDFPQGTLCNFITSVIFMVFILNVSVKPNHWFGLETPLFAKMGKFTYGIYMYHPAVCILVGTAFVQLGLKGAISDIALDLTIISTTILISFVSYRWFESWFLQWQNKKPAAVAAVSTSASS